MSSQGFTLRGVKSGLQGPHSQGRSLLTLCPPMLTSRLFPYPCLLCSRPEGSCSCLQAESGVATPDSASEPALSHVAGLGDLVTSDTVS